MKNVTLNDISNKEDYDYLTPLHIADGVYSYIKDCFGKTLIDYAIGTKFFQATLI